MLAFAQQILSNFKVIGRRGRHCRYIDEVHEFEESRCRLYAVLFGDRARGLRIRVEDSRELDSRKFGVNSCMILADAAYSHDACSNAIAHIL